MGLEAVVDVLKQEKEELAAELEKTKKTLQARSAAAPGMGGGMPGGGMPGGGMPPGGGQMPLPGQQPPPPPRIPAPPEVLAQQEAQRKAAEEMRKVRQQEQKLRRQDATAGDGDGDADAGTGKGLRGGGGGGGGGEADTAAARQAARRPLAPYPLTEQQAQWYADHPVGSAPSSESEPAPSDTRTSRALLVICYNRPQYLKRTLQSVLDHFPAYNRPHIYVSQDGNDQGVTAVIQSFQEQFAADHADVPFTHLRHDNTQTRGEPAGWAVGYYKLSQHFRWALNKLFNEAGHRHVIILEDDLEVAVDFFDYFSAMEPLLDSDDTLLAASAWNDLGQQQFTADPRQVYRSDFFPGLGWMLSKHAWEELGPKWPDAFWDDWMREPPQRKGRHFLRPEVSRSFTFGEQGVSASQFYTQYLATIRLNEQPVDWSSEDLSYLELSSWDADVSAAIDAATPLPFDRIKAHTCTAAADAGEAVLPGQAVTQDVKVVYRGNDQYVALADRFGYINDIKANVPRTAYKGVVIIKHNGCRKLLVPAPA